MIFCLFTLNCVVLVILPLSHAPLASPLNFFFKILGGRPLESLATPLRSGCTNYSCLHPPPSPEPFLLTFYITYFCVCKTSTSKRQNLQQARKSWTNKTIFFPSTFLLYWFILLILQQQIVHNQESKKTKKQKKETKSRKKIKYKIYRFLQGLLLRNTVARDTSG